MSVTVYQKSSLKRINRAFQQECRAYKLLDSSNNVVSNTLILGTASMERNDDSADSTDDVFRLQNTPIDFDIDISGSSKTVHKIRVYNADSSVVKLEAVFDTPVTFNVSGTYQVQSLYVQF